MFQGRNRLRFIGKGGSIVWGYRTAIAVGPWSIAKEQGPQGQWRLTARQSRLLDRFSARQTPLLFTAPRLGGFWAFPVLELHVGPDVVTARIGPPVH
jgi:hypothetical protein